jgi:hypothetical protein
MELETKQVDTSQCTESSANLAEKSLTLQNVLAFQALQRAERELQPYAQVEHVAKVLELIATQLLTQVPRAGARALD